MDEAGTRPVDDGAGGAAAKAEQTGAAVDRIAAALAGRDRGALRKLAAELSGAVLPLDQRKWLARLDHAVGELARAYAEFDRLSQHGPLDLEDAWLAVAIADRLGILPPLDRLLAGVPPTGTIEIAARWLPLLVRAGERLFGLGDRVGAERLFDLVDRAPGGQDLVDPAFRAGAPTQPDLAAGTPRQMAASEPLSAAAEPDAEELGADAGKLLLAARAALGRGDIAAVSALLGRFPDDLPFAPGQGLAEFGEDLLRAGEPALLPPLADLIGRVAGGRPELLFLAVEIAFARQDYAAAGAAIGRAQRKLGAGYEKLVALKRAELSAFTGRADLALDFLAGLEPLRGLDTTFLRPVVAVLSEAKAWRQLLSLVKARLADWFVFAQHASAVVTAALACDAGEEVLEALDAAVARDETRTDLRQLRLILLERLVGPGSLGAILEDEDATALEAYRARIVAKAQAVGEGASAIARERSAYARDTAIYYCTDSNYLAPAFNSIHSLLLANAPFLNDTALHLFVDDEDVEIAEAVAEGLRRHYPCSLTVTPSSELIGEFSGRLRTRYGIFTGGEELSQSAYYRIFAIDRLLGQDAKRRALYIDSDTLVTGEISRLFASLDGAMPLAARREVDKVEVRRVEALHRLERGAYFNSGVLAVDLRHPDLPRALDRTMHALSEESELLVYHDQCALNRGFRGACAPLPAQYNSFCVSGDTFESPGAAGVILHFLDRPKPWQPGYVGPFSVYWYRYWRELARVVDEAALRDLVARSPV